MAHHFTKQEAKAWLERQAKKPLSAKVVIFNKSGDILITKPNYKPGWFFVGGMVGDNESPLQACIREVKEEIGVNLSRMQLHFSGVRYGISKTGGEYIHFLFSTMLTRQQEAAIKKDDEWEEALKWVTPQSHQEEILDHTYKLFMNASQNAGAASYAEQDEFFVTSGVEVPHD